MHRQQTIYQISAVESERAAYHVKNHRSQRIVNGTFPNTSGCSLLHNNLAYEKSEMSVYGKIIYTMLLQR